MPARAPTAEERTTILAKPGQRNRQDVTKTRKRESCNPDAARPCHESAVRNESAAGL